MLHTAASQSHHDLDIDHSFARLSANMSSILELWSALHVHGEHIRDAEARFWATRRARVRVKHQSGAS